MDDPSVTEWPPPFSNMVAAPAGEIPATGRRLPSTDQLEWAHKGLQVVFMGLALIGLVVLLGTGSTPSQIVRGAARKHAVA